MIEERNVFLYGEKDMTSAVQAAVAATSGLVNEAGELRKDLLRLLSDGAALKGLQFGIKALHPYVGETMLSLIAIPGFAALDENRNDLHAAGLSLVTAWHFSQNAVIIDDTCMTELFANVDLAGSPGLRREYFEDMIGRPVFIPGLCWLQAAETPERIRDLKNGRCSFIGSIFGAVPERDGSLSVYSVELHAGLNCVPCRLTNFKKGETVLTMKEACERVSMIMPRADRREIEEGLKLDAPKYLSLVLFTQSAAQEAVTYREEAQISAPKRTSKGVKLFMPHKARIVRLGVPESDRIAEMRRALNDAEREGRPAPQTHPARWAVWNTAERKAAGLPPLFKWMPPGIVKPAKKTPGRKSTSRSGEFL